MYNLERQVFSLKLRRVKRRSKTLITCQKRILVSGIILHNLVYSKFCNITLILQSFVNYRQQSKYFHILSTMLRQNFFEILEWEREREKKKIVKARGEKFFTFIWLLLLTCYEHCVSFSFCQSSRSSSIPLFSSLFFVVTRLHNFIFALNPVKVLIKFACINTKWVWI